MTGVSASARTPIGIDLGARVIKAAQLTRTRKGWRIEALCAIPRSTLGAHVDHEEVQNLQSVLRRQGFTDNQVVLAVPSEKLLTGILELPARGSGASLDQIARMEMARMHKLAPNSFEMSYWDLPSAAQARNSAQVMAVGCSHDEANQLLDAFEAAGMDVKAFDVRSWAAARACEPVLAPEPGSTAILDLGWNGAYLSVICHGVVAYERSLPEAGAAPLLQSTCKKFQLELETAERVLETIGFGGEGSEQLDEYPHEQFVKVLRRHFAALVEELQAPFSYIANQYAQGGVTRVLLVGGAAAIPGLSEFLGSVITPEVISVNPTTVAQCPRLILPKASNASLTLAVGLAQYGEG